MYDLIYALLGLAQQYYHLDRQWGTALKAGDFDLCHTLTAARSATHQKWIATRSEMWAHAKAKGLTSPLFYSLGTESNSYSGLDYYRHPRS